MSYDIRIAFKIEGGQNEYYEFCEPDKSSPTYNLRQMFVNCMDWDYRQGEYYSLKFALEKINLGIYELENHREKYLKYNPPNGWGDLDGALACLRDWKSYIEDDVCQRYPIDLLYFSW